MLKVDKFINNVIYNSLYTLNDVYLDINVIKNKLKETSYDNLLCFYDMNNIYNINITFALDNMNSQLMVLYKLDKLLFCKHIENMLFEQILQEIDK